MKVSVLIPYSQGRRSLLERTLWLLRRQTYPDYEVWILDDGSDEHVSDLCGDNIIYEKVRDAGAAKRSANMAWNHGYRKCDGEFIVLGHPEYLMPLHAIESLVEKYDGYRLGPTAYALSPETTARLDRWPWRDDLDSLQATPGFWSFETPWHWTNMEAKGWCHHFAFTGQPREAWDILDFLPLTEAPGFADNWILGPETAGGRPPRPAGFSVYHQHHARWKPGEVGVGLSVRMQRIEAARLLAEG